ncbi:unnamed protein product [Arctogadus glacialis]
MGMGKCSPLSTQQGVDGATTQPLSSPYSLLRGLGEGDREDTGSTDRTRRSGLNPSQSGPGAVVVVVAVSVVVLSSWWGSSLPEPGWRACR